MYTITIDVEKCAACEECISSCPIEGFGMQEVNGKNVAVYTLSGDDCIGCLACESVCDEGAIAVLEN